MSSPSPFPRFPATPLDAPGAGGAPSPGGSDATSSSSAPASSAEALRTCMLRSCSAALDEAAATAAPGVADADAMVVVPAVGSAPTSGHYNERAKGEGDAG